MAVVVEDVEDSAAEGAGASEEAAAMAGDEKVGGAGERARAIARSILFILVRLSRS